MHPDHIIAGSPEDTSNINITTDQVNSPSLLLVNGSRDNFRVEWNPESLLPLLKANLFTVNIRLQRLEKENLEWEEFVDIKLGLPNNGTASFQAPNISKAHDDADAYPVAIQISVGPPSSDSPQVEMYRDFLGNVTDNVSLWRSDLFYADSLDMFESCMDWYGMASSFGNGTAIRSRVPCCKETQKKAAAPNSGFVRDRRDDLIAFLHPNADTCYLQETITRYVPDHPDD